MRIQSFIFNWKGNAANAAKLEAAITPIADVLVINSEEGLAESHPRWVHLDDTAYFSAQWNKALELFHGDVLFHVQADVVFDDFERLFRRARELFDAYRVGVYEPNVDWTDTQYDRTLLPEVETNLCRVPVTDCTCWFVASEVLREFPKLDASINRYGWGVPPVVAALSRRQQRLCVRDYSFLVSHPRGRGYDSRAAAAARIEYLNALDPRLAAEVVHLYIEGRTLGWR
jgi:hypothetical protein